MGELVQDLRFAVRMLRKRWGVSLIAIGSLAVAIGGNTAVFGLINSLLFQPLTVEAPERIAILQERRTEQTPGLSTLSTSLATHGDMAERSRAASAWTVLRPTVLGLRDGERAEPISSAQVGVDFFDLLGVAPARGRAFLPEEGVPGGRKVAIVTPEFWERHRGGEGEPLGEVLTLGGEPVEVVGVLPEAFSFLFSAADIYVPLTDSPTESPRDRRDVVSIARLAPGATMEQLAAEVTAISSALATEYPEVQRDWTMDVFNARFDIPDSRTKIFYALLQGSVFFVLLIACANIANLLLARAQERRREIALRTAMGAGRGRLVRQLATESALLVFVGASLGLGLGWLGIRALANHFAGLLPASFTPSLEMPVVLFTAGISVLAGLVFGVAPALQTMRQSQTGALREGSGKASGGRSRTLITRTLVVAEIALSLVALGGGAMLVRSFLELQGADPGFDGSPLLTARIQVPASKYPDDEGRQILLDDILTSARHVEGVRAAAVVNALPRNFQAPSDTFRLAGDARDAGAGAPRVVSLIASPEYVDAFDIAVLQGRFFDEGDRAGAAPVAVVNRSFVTRWLEGGEALGRFVDFKGETRQIVGVVEDVQQVLVSTPGQVENEAIYVPAAQLPGGGFTLVVASAGDPGELKEPVRTALQAIDRDMTLSQLLTMDEVMEQFFAGIDVFNTILGGFGILAILLAALGTYGVLAYQVTQRRHEIGIRMAIGARSGEVVRMVTRQGAVMAFLGLALGGAVLVPLTRLLRSILQGFATVEANTGFFIAAILLVVTMAASLVPARRAAGLDPVQALRSE